MNPQTNFSNSVWQSIDKNSLMPVDPVTRGVAEDLYAQIADLPIISPHGHVDPQMLLENKPFESAADLFLYQNHYITRLLHADGVRLSEILRPAEQSVDELQNHGRAAWQLFADRQLLFSGTASGYWFARELKSVFGIEEPLNSWNAQQVYETIQARLNEPEMLPQNLFREFQIQVLATTDAPSDTLEAHRKLAELELGGRVVPTFRPDLYINPAATGWVPRTLQLIEGAGQPTSQQGFVAALAERRQFFIERGAFSIDIGAETAYTEILDSGEAEKLFQGAISGNLTEAQQLSYRGHMIAEMIRMSCDDGLTVTLHVGVHRNHSASTLERFGPDTGHDLPIQAEFVRNLHPVLNRYGDNPNLHLILFALDETTWAREIAPLAGFYPSVFVGAPWWFLDAPDAALRFRRSVTDSVGFYRGSGFIDDTRAFLSIPTRHDMARRIDAAFLAELVQQCRISLAEAQQIAVDTVTTIPRRAFKL